MEAVVIKNWNQHGDYMLYARMVDETKKWIMLETAGTIITARGKKDALDDFCKLLTKQKINFSRNDA
jgi:hypothetical protein